MESLLPRVEPTPLLPPLYGRMWVELNTLQSADWLTNHQMRDAHVLPNSGVRSCRLWHYSLDVICRFIFRCLKWFQMGDLHHFKSHT